MNRQTVWTALFLLSAYLHLRLPAQKLQRFRIMEYNVENMFDTLHVAGKEDSGFTPQGEYQWNSRRYWAKLSKIGKVIAACGGLTPVDVVALIEVENDSVLSHLTQRTKLRRLGYEYIITHSADVRGINVALLYQPPRFRPISKDSIRVLPHEKHLQPTRDILHVAGEITSGDTLDIFVCHLPSRRGGIPAMRYREEIARKLKNAVNNIINNREHPLVVMTGDFNGFYTEKLFTSYLKTHLADSYLDIPMKSETAISQGSDSAFLPDSTFAKSYGIFMNTYSALVQAQKPTFLMRPECPYVQDSLSFHTLYLLSHDMEASKGITGTYKFRGEWNQLDHFIVNGHLLTPKRYMHPSTSRQDCRIVDYPFLLKNYGKDTDDYRPYRTYLGTFCQGGYSDHLPIVLDIWY